MGQQTSTGELCFFVHSIPCTNQHSAAGHEQTSPQRPQPNPVNATGADTGAGVGSPELEETKTALTLFEGAPAEQAAVFSVVSLENNVDLAAAPVDQTPGQSGVAIGSEGVVWKCLACRTSNHVTNAHCGNCQQLRVDATGQLISTEERERVAALIQRKLTSRHLYLSIDDGLSMLQYCFEQGRVNAEQIAGETVVMIIGNTGAGKSTFVNYLAGCTLESKYVVSDIDKVVAVKPVSEGGRRDELAKIGHGKISQTFMPNVIKDDVSGLCFCDCAGFLDSRGTEISIANTVNLITTLNSAKAVKVVLLITRDTLKANRGKGLVDLLTVCTKLFGSVEKFKQHLGCVLVGCSLFDASTTLERLKSYLTYETPPIMADLIRRLFLFDVLGSHDGWWGSVSSSRGSSREECIKQIKSMPAISCPADVFHAVLLDSDEEKLVEIGMEINKRIEQGLRNADYATCSAYFHTLQQMSAIKHITVERIIHECYMTICKHFMKEASVMKEHCHLSAFAEAEQVLQRLQAAATFFRGKAWVEVLPFDQLFSFCSQAHNKHAQQVQRDQVLQLQLQKAGNQIDLLTAALEAATQKDLMKPL